MKHKRLVLIVSLVVVSVAGIGGLTMFMTNLRKNVAKTQKDMAALEKGLATFYFQKSRYPTAEEGINAGVKAWAVVLCSQSSSPQTCIDQPRKTPVDAWGREYRYRTDNPKHAVLSSAGADGEFDTTDDLRIHSPGN